MGIYKRPDSKKWWISYYHNGERVREGVSTNKREAEKVLMQRLTAINENENPVLQKQKNKKIKFAGFAENYITSRERILSRNEMGLLVANAQTPLGMNNSPVPFFTTIE